MKIYQFKLRVQDDKYDTLKVQISNFRPRNLAKRDLNVSVADLGFSGGGDGLGDEGEGEGGRVPPPAGGPGAWPPGKFLQIDVENMHFRRHV
jgi:hypothetical protein